VFNHSAACVFACWGANHDGWQRGRIGDILAWLQLAGGILNVIAQALIGAMVIGAYGDNPATDIPSGVPVVVGVFLIFSIIFLALGLLYGIVMRLLAIGIFKHVDNTPRT